MRYTPIDGGYSIVLRVGRRRFLTPVVGGVANDGPDLTLLQLYGHVLPTLNGTFFDVGANVGQRLLAVRAVVPDMPYIGFEPNVVCAAYTHRLMRDTASTMQWYCRSR
jgi:hypothetical protein